MDEQQLAKKLLELFNRNSNINLNDHFRNDPQAQELLRTTQFRHYRASEQQEILKLLIPALIESVGMSVPSLIEAKEIFIPALIEKRTLDFGDIGILFYSIKKHFGAEEEFSEDLCPCDQNWMRTPNGCRPTCSHGEYNSQEECANAVVGGNIYYYHALAANFNDFQAANLTNYYYGVNDAQARSGLMFVTSTAGDVVGVQRTIQQDPNNPSQSDTSLFKFAIGNKQTGAISQLVGWESVNIYITSSYSELNTYYSDPGRTTLVGMGLKIGDRSTGGMGNWVVSFPDNANVQVVAGNQIPGNSAILWRRDFYETTSTNGYYWCMDAVPMGYLMSVQQLQVTLNPPYPQSYPQTPRDSDGNWFSADLYFGGTLENPVKLGTYPVVSFAKDESTGLGYGISRFDEWKYPDNSTYRKDDYIERGDQFVAHIAAVEKDLWEVIIKYGYRAEYTPNPNHWNNWDYNVYWCKIDKILVTNKGQISKITHKYPQEVVTHPNNPYSFWAKNWNYNVPLTEANKPDDYFTTFTQQEWTNLSLIERLSRCYLRTALNFVDWPDGGALNLWEQNYETGLPLYIQGARLGEDVADPKLGLPRIGCSFIKDPENNDIWAIDICLNQWQESDTKGQEVKNIFVDAIRTKELKVTIKAGKISSIYPNNEGYGFVNRTVIKFTGTPKGLTDKKIFALKADRAGILEACCWLSIDKLKTLEGEIPYVIYQTGIEVGATGNWEEGTTPGIITYPLTFSSKHPYYGDLFNIPFLLGGGSTIPNAQGNYINPGTKYEYENYVWEFKNCQGDRVLLAPANTRAVLGILPENLYYTPIDTQNISRYKIIGGC